MLDAEQERQLIEQISKHPAAFRDLYRHYFPRVYGYIAYRIAARQDVEDLVSETFMKVFEHSEQFEYRGEGSFAAWVFRIAHRAVSDFYRRHPTQTSTLNLDDLPPVAADLPALDENFIQQEKFTRVRHLIQTLSQRRQEVIVMRFFGGLRNQEIAQVLQLDERTVASHLCRGLEELQAKFETMEEQP